MTTNETQRKGYLERVPDTSIISDLKSPSREFSLVESLDSPLPVPYWTLVPLCMLITVTFHWTFRVYLHKNHLSSTLVPRPIRVSSLLLYFFFFKVPTLLSIQVGSHTFCIPRTLELMDGVSDPDFCRWRRRASRFTFWASVGFLSIRLSLLSPSSRYAHSPILGWGSNRGRVGGKEYKSNHPPTIQSIHSANAPSFVL